MNTMSVMRLLQQLQGGRPTPALIPVQQRGYEEEEEPERRPRGRPRKERSPSPPPRKSRDKRRSPSPKKSKRRARSPSTSSEDSSNYGSSSSDYSSYDEADDIKERYRKEPCEYVSPAGLESKKTKKEVVNYLEEKKCPKIETHAKKRKHVPPATATAAPTAQPTAPPPPPPATASTHGASGDAPAVPAEPAVGKKKMGRPPKPVDPNAKPKRPPTAYNLAVSKHIKAGVPFKEAVARAKEETKKPEAK